MAVGVPVGEPIRCWGHGAAAGGCAVNWGDWVTYEDACDAIDKATTRSVWAGLVLGIVVGLAMGYTIWGMR